MHLFSYGTRQLPDVPRATFGRLLSGRPDAIIGFGTVFDLTAEQLRAADAYEVADYARVEVPLRSGQTAWVYVFAG
ncbi:MAG TPA: gamma-glutamylcyclotransferase family protein [Baekduia sp.]